MRKCSCGKDVKVSDWSWHINISSGFKVEGCLECVRSWVNKTILLRGD